MGFFDNKPAASGGLTPITKARMKEAFEGQGWSYHVDSDGDIMTGWEYGMYLVTLQGQQSEVFCVRGKWRVELPASEAAALQDACNEWNRERLWPKTYTRMDDQGMLQAYAELNVDFEEGLTDEQLNRQFMCVFATGESFFEELNGRYPQQWAAVQAEN